MRIPVARKSGARHAFNNDARPARHDEAAARLAWKRTVAHFKKNLGGEYLHRKDAVRHLHR
ncbi:MAG: dienelactone hydrolase family protein [Proteobacteria bacterium]|nr:dienelactone hydrolase family protein [Pseudomonadota bacterium]